MKLDKENIAKIAADSSYHAIGALPSQYKPYSSKYGVSFTEEDFFIRGFRIEEMRLLSKAASLGENGHLLRAVDNCISVPVESLTIGDFWYVMFWLRTNSFTDFPYTVTWDCNQPVFKHVDGGAILTYDREDWPDDATLEPDYLGGLDNPKIGGRLPRQGCG